MSFFLEQVRAFVSSLCLSVFRPATLPFTLHADGVQIVFRVAYGSKKSKWAARSSVLQWKEHWCRVQTQAWPLPASYWSRAPHQ